MISGFLKIVFFSSVTLMLLFTSHLYISSQNNSNVPKKVAESTDIIDRVNNIRFAFKMSLLTHRSSMLYTQAILKKDANFIEEAIDSADAAIAFVSILDEDVVFNKVIIDNLNNIKSVIRKKGIMSSIEDVEKVEDLVDKIHIETEKRERSVWTDIQRQYVSFVYKDYKDIRTYQLVAISSVVILIIFLYQLIQNFRFYKRVKAKETELEKIAYYDRLTGLPNRYSLEIELEKYIENSVNSNKNGAIALVNIDDFKRYNDSCGRATGDQIIKQVAITITNTIGKLGTVNRIGCDEFAIYFPVPSDPRDILKRVIRIHESLRPPLNISGQDFNVTVSIGIANTLGNKINPTTWHDLMKNADLALLKAKEDGKNCFHSFDQNMRDVIEHEQALESEIKQGLASEQFELYYQPLFCIKERKITTLEALVRWNHPDKGLLTPNNFIKVVDGSYLATEFGEWVICKVIEQQHLWKNQNLDIAVSLNLPLKLILDVEFITKIKLLTSSLNANLEKIYFEVSNYGIYQVNPKVKAVLNELSELGFRFYLDDFGADSSSISTIEELPVSAIKIDMKHVRSISKNKKENLIVDGIMSIAKSKGLLVIAEGVENKTQADYLNTLHCDYLQGYLISKPLPVQEITLLLQRHLNKRRKSKTATH